MSVKTILVEPDIILRQKSQPVNIVGPDEKKLMNDMLDTMYAANGIGLAAIQIGVPQRIIVMDISRDKENKNPIYFVNPVIKNRDLEKSIYEEVKSSNPEIIDNINNTGKLDEDSKKKLISIMEKFKKNK